MIYIRNTLFITGVISVEYALHQHVSQQHDYTLTLLGDTSSKIVFRVLWTKKNYSGRGIIIVISRWPHKK